jgi:hypothetical protein
MISDCVLDEKTVMDEEAAQWRIDEFWKLREFNMQDIHRLDSERFTTAYGLRGLGMPVHGIQSNF